MSEQRIVINKYLGKDGDGEYVFVDGAFLYDGGFHGVTGTTARENSKEEVCDMLQCDDEIWKMCVADGSTTLGLEEFNERELENWQERVDYTRSELAVQAGFDQDNEESFLEDTGGGRCFPCAFEDGFRVEPGCEALVALIILYESASNADCEKVFEFFRQYAQKEE